MFALVFLGDTRSKSRIFTYVCIEVNRNRMN
jgi:hypothetical protein